MLVLMLLQIYILKNISETFWFERNKINQTISTEHLSLLWGAILSGYKAARDQKKVIKWKGSFFNNNNNNNNNNNKYKNYIAHIQ